MRKIFFVLMFLTWQVSAQDMARVKKNIDTLCSPAMAGRGYIEKGDRKAAEFIAAEFKKLGLSSFTEDYFQPLSFNINTHPKKLTIQIDKEKLVLGEDFIINPVSSKARGSKKIVWLDTLIFTDKEHQKQFLTTNLKNSVLVYHQRDYKKLTELPAEYIKKSFEAKATLELQTKLTATVSTKAVKTAIFEVDEKKISREAKKAKFRIDNVFIENYQTQNVIGYIKGTENPDEFLVLTGHYDHLGKMGQIYFPGANDNASGISMLLEMAAYYKEHPPKYSMVFIAFAGEEAGLLGSHYYTENPLFPLEKIKFLINMDLVGTGDDGITVVNGSLFAEEFNLLQKLNTQYSLLPAVNKRGAAANSDHYFFTLKKVRSFFIYTLGGIKAYHDIHDKAETLPLTKYKPLFELLIKFFEQIP